MYSDLWNIPPHKNANLAACWVCPQPGLQVLPVRAGPLGGRRCNVSWQFLVWALGWRRGGGVVQPSESRVVWSFNIGAFIIRIGFWGILYYKYNNNKEPPIR